MVNPRFWSTLALSAAFASVFGMSAPEGQQNVRLNRAIDRLAQGKAVIGNINGDFSLDQARTLATSGLDFIILEMEHQPFDVERLQMFLLGTTDKAGILKKGNLQPNVTPLVRIPQYGRENLAFMVKQVLDVGVMGIMFPAIDDKEQALNAVRSARYPQVKGAADTEPIGQRGSSPGNAVWFWGLTSPEYHQRADVWPLDPRGEILLLLQIETADGVKNINDIISVPGIGVVFIGPNDLSLSLGVPQGAPEHEAAIQTVLKACLARNVPCAITTSANTVQQRLKEGFKMVTIGGGISAGIEDGLKAGRALAP
jgi:4-hydroxy-2-oxoheptanedioate aldolase